jgi:hypothetical protein
MRSGWPSRRASYEEQIHWARGQLSREREDGTGIGLGIGIGIAVALAMSVARLPETELTLSGTIVPSMTLTLSPDGRRRVYLAGPRGERPRLSIERRRHDPVRIRGRADPPRAVGWRDAPVAMTTSDAAQGERRRARRMPSSAWARRGRWRTQDL